MFEVSLFPFDLHCLDFFLNCSQTTKLKGAQKRGKLKGKLDKCYPKPAFPIMDVLW